MFVAHGFDETKISDIASAVGISDSTIYEHFKNKQDILFLIRREKSDEIYLTTCQHLKGLIGAETKLRKLIWNYMEFMSENEKYSYLLIFELRTNRDYYKLGNEQLREFVKLFEDVIVEGQNNLEFRTDVSVAYILKLIFGTIDLMIINWFLRKKLRPIDLIDHFWDLLIPAISIRNGKQKPVDKRNAILSAATSVFATMGYRKARIQDIAKLAGVADGTIYQYFQNKEDILFSIPIEKTKELINLQQEHLTGIRNTDIKLTVLINDYLTFLDSNMDLGSVMLFDLRYNHNFYNHPAHQLFQDYTRVYYETICEGMERKHLRDDINPHVVVQMIFGMLDHSLLTCILFQKPRMMFEVYDPLCKLILSALQKQEL